MISAPRQPTKRNAPCPCGSGRKYKNCCLREQALVTVKHNEENAEAIDQLQTAANHHQEGRLAEAEQIYRQILNKQPEQPDALHLLGLIAQQMGQHQAALELIAKAIQIAPNATMYSNLGLAFDSLGKPEMAITSFREAITIAPNDPDAYINLGATLNEQRRFVEATECFYQALALKPDSAEAYFNLGMVLQMQGKSEEAIEKLNRGLALQPASAKAYALLASNHMDMGRFDAAREEIARAVELDPNSAPALTLTAKLRKMTSDDAPWLEKAQHALPLVRAKLSGDAIGLRYAIGKYYDDTRQYDAAFSAFAQANAIQRQKEGGLDRARLVNFVNAMISVYSAEALRHDKPGASDSERPVLIVGMPRSGTSLIEQIIASHPEAHGAGELPFWGQLPADDQHLAISGQLEADFLHKLALTYAAELQGHTTSALRVVDKMPGNIFWLGLVATVFPRAHIIHARRNPLDTCLSIYFLHFNKGHPYATDLDDLAFYYREYVRLMNHWRNVLPPERFLEVSYEALTKEQEDWSRRIIDFLGLQWDDRCLEFHKTERKVGTASNWQVRQKVYQTSKQRWRHYEKHLGPLLGLFDIDQP